MTTAMPHNPQRPEVSDPVEEVGAASGQKDAGDARKQCGGGERDRTVRGMKHGVWGSGCHRMVAVLDPVPRMRAYATVSVRSWFASSGLPMLVYLCWFTYVGLRKKPALRLCYGNACGPVTFLRENLWRRGRVREMGSRTGFHGFAPPKFALFVHGCSDRSGLAPEHPCMAPVSPDDPLCASVPSNLAGIPCSLRPWRT